MSRVLVVDAVRVRREGLAVLLGALPVVSRVAVAAPEDAPSEAALGSCPDAVLLVDGARPDAGLLAGLRAAAPGARIVALGVREGEAAAWAQAGCWGCLPPDATLEALEDALHAAVRADPAASPAGGREGARRLTPREKEILACLALGLTNKQISRRLSIHVLTVKNHVHSILEKLGAGRRGEAAARMRLVPHDILAPATPDPVRGAGALSFPGALVD